ncbi:g10662 [Coccomyxa elongata]
MAARHLQRLRAAVNEKAEEEHSSSEEEIIDAKAPFNPFDLLSDEEGGPAADAGEDDEDDACEHSNAARTPDVQSSSAGRKGRKTKKKKKKGAPQASEDADTRNTAAADEEDLEKLLSELNIQTASTSAAAVNGQKHQQSAEAVSGQPLLAVDPRKLRGEEEMRRIFGARTMREEERDNANAGGLVGANRRTRRAIARGQLRRQPLKRGLLINPKDTWPRFDGGISMEPAGTTPDGLQIFSYTHSAAYQGVQALFQECQATFDPNSIAALLGQHPYHIDALMAMYELHRATGQHETADEMLERCLYALELACHPWFNPSTANCRLPYRQEQNRPLFTALFKHMQGLSRKGLHTTAFEVAKLILLLDPDDPMGVMLCVDYCALRAHNYSWLQRLAEGELRAGPEGRITAGSLPNLAFSIPLARLRLWQQRTERAAAAASRAGGASKSGHDNDDADTQTEFEGCIDALTQAVLLHPLAVTQLMKRLQEKGVGNDAEWLSILQRSLFATSADDVSASLAHLTDIFVERHHLLWKAADVQQWLKRACKEASEGPMAESAADYACARQQAFPPSDDNAYCHLRVADFSDAVAALPPDELQGVLHGPNRRPEHWRNDGDGFPDIGEALAAIAAVEREGQEPMDLETLRRMHPLQALLRTLLPWVNAGRAPDFGAEAEAGPAPAGAAPRAAAAPERDRAPLLAYVEQQLQERRQQRAAAAAAGREAAAAAGPAQQNGAAAAGDGEPPPPQMPHDPLERQLLATLDRMSEEELGMLYNRMEAAGAMEPFWEALERNRARQQ